MRIGGNHLGNGVCEFCVWSPFSSSVSVKIIAPAARSIPMEKTEGGYWRAAADNTFPGARYLYTLDGTKDLPDPASHFQPDGVHLSSCIVDHDSFAWRDECYRPRDLYGFVIYELHPGTFTNEGTLAAAALRLPELRDLGITAVEVMPVAQFPGERNWGYDGVYPFAVHNSYGGPNGLKTFVDACHALDIAVILDVVYNHLGPEGNYLHEYGPYFTGTYKTPWGNAVNFDDAHNGGVRNFFIENALFWLDRYHVDALRLDAVHAIFDRSAVPFLQELARRAGEFSKQRRTTRVLIAESDLNDTRIIKPETLGGCGLDAQWNDDFHHALHALLTGERQGYYQDFGSAEDLAAAFRDGFVYSGQYSRFRKKNFGNPSAGLPARQFVVCSQNHDQVGNRMLGERLSILVPFDALKLAAGAVLLSPYLPLIFMGEEYGETAPFLYFISHSDPALVTAVRNGRKEEFREFGFSGNVPDPDAPETFLASKLHWDKRTLGSHAVLLNLYKKLIGMRASFRETDGVSAVCAHGNDAVVSLHRGSSNGPLFLVFNFNTGEQTVIMPPGEWKILLDSSGTEWLGPGPLISGRPGRHFRLRGTSFAVFGTHEATDG